MTEKIVMCACNTSPIRFFNKPGFQHEVTTPNDTLLLFNGWGSILGVGAAKIFSFRLYSQYGCIIISQSEDSVFIQPIWEYNCSKFIQPNWVYIMDKWNHHIGCITCRMGCRISKFVVEIQKFWVLLMSVKGPYNNVAYLLRRVVNNSKYIGCSAICYWAIYIHDYVKLQTKGPPLMIIILHPLKGVVITDITKGSLFTEYLAYMKQCISNFVLSMYHAVYLMIQLSHKCLKLHGTIVPTTAKGPNLPLWNVCVISILSLRYVGNIYITEHVFCDLLFIACYFDVIILGDWYYKSRHYPKNV